MGGSDLNARSSAGPEWASVGISKNRNGTDTKLGGVSCSISDEDGQIVIRVDRADLDAGLELPVLISKEADFYSMSLIVGVSDELFERFRLKILEDL